MSKIFFISAGDYSGNLIGAPLLDALSARYPGATYEGIGGDEMGERTFTSITTIKKTAVSGFTTILRHYFFFKALLKTCKKKLSRGSYDMVILIDWPGFNMRLLEYCKHYNIPVYYIAPPQVWAWKKKRVHAFNGVSVQTVFAFENEIYQQAGAMVHYCGHPALDRIEISDERKRETIALLPGSRKAVVRRNFKMLLLAARMVQSELNDSPSIVAVLPEFLKEDTEIKKLARGIRVVEEMHSVLSHTRFALAVPGTNNVELLAHRIPAIVMYRAGWLNYAIAKLFVSIRFVSAVNILAARELFPEFVFCQKASAEKFVSFAVNKVLTDEQQIIADLGTLSTQMGEKGFTQLAADTIGERLDG